MIPTNTPPCFRERLRALIGTPYGFRGEGGGLDCWQLVQRASLDLFGRALPDYPEVQSFDDVPGTMLHARQHYAEVGPPLPGDVVMLRVKAVPLHVGLVLEPPWFLHTLKGREAVAQRYDDRALRATIIGFYRWLA